VFQAFEEPVSEEIPPEPEDEPQFADEDDDEPETPTTADFLVILVITDRSDVQNC
jgi:hypothetical protein